MIVFITLSVVAIAITYAVRVRRALIRAFWSAAGWLILALGED